MRNELSRIFFVSKVRCLSSIVLCRADALIFLLSDIAVLCDLGYRTYKRASQAMAHASFVP